LPPFTSLLGLPGIVRTQPAPFTHGVWRSLYHLGEFLDQVELLRWVLGNSHAKVGKGFFHVAESLCKNHDLGRGSVQSF
jgi:hypothetical protein